MWIEINSSNIQKIAYLNKTLFIFFVGDTIYQYDDFSEKQYLWLLKSESKGTYFRRVIRPNFTGVKIQKNDLPECLASTL